MWSVSSILNLVTEVTGVQHLMTAGDWIFLSLRTEKSKEHL